MMVWPADMTRCVAVIAATNSGISTIDTWTHAAIIAGALESEGRVTRFPPRGSPPGQSGGVTFIHYGTNPLVLHEAALKPDPAWHSYLKSANNPVLATYIMPWCVLAFRQTAGLPPILEH